jgi:hypothetical protein
MQLSMKNEYKFPICFWKCRNEENNLKHWPEASFSTYSAELLSIHFCLLRGFFSSPSPLPTRNTALCLFQRKR